MKMYQETEKYRLCRKKNGEVVLQRMILVSKEDTDWRDPYPENVVAWVDIEEVEEE